VLWRWAVNLAWLLTYLIAAHGDDWDYIWLATWDIREKEKHGHPHMVCAHNPIRLTTLRAVAWAINVSRLGSQGRVQGGDGRGIPCNPRTLSHLLGKWKSGLHRAPKLYLRMWIP